MTKHITIVAFFLLGVLAAAMCHGQDIPTRLREEATKLNALADAPTATGVRESIANLEQIAVDIENPPPPPPPVFDESHDPGMLMGVPDFGLTPTLFTIAGAGPDDVVRIGHADSAEICEPLTINVLAVHGTVEICSELRVQTLLVYHDGTLVLRSGAHVVIRDIPIDTTLDPAQWGNGVIVQGKVRCPDAEVRTHRVYVENIKTGDTTITIRGEVPADWRVGDELILPRVRQQNDGYYTTLAKPLKLYPAWHGESERATITAIDGSVITLDEPARFDHAGAVGRNNEQVTWVRIGHLPRPIVIESENPNGVRGHFVAMGNADIWYRGIQLRNLGRTNIGPIDSWDGNGEVGTNQIGRYAGFHVHHCYGPMGGIVDAPHRDKDGQPYQWIVENCSSIGCDEVKANGGDAERPEKWVGVTVHRSSWGLIKDCVFYNGAGSIISFEDGVERNVDVVGNWIADSNARTRFIDPATGLLYGPEELLPGVQDQTRRADSRGTGAFGVWWLRGLELYCEDNTIYDINPGNKDQGWDPDQRPTAYWRGHHPLFDLAPMHRGDMPEEWVLFEQCGVQQLVTVQGGEFGGADQKSQTIRSAVLGDESMAERFIVRDHIAFHCSTGYSSYQNPLLLERCMYYGDPARLHDDNMGYDASQGNSVVRDCEAHNCWIGFQIRAGRGFSDFLVENFTSSALEDFGLEPSPISQEHVNFTVRGFKSQVSGMIFHKLLTGYKGSSPMGKRNRFRWAEKDYVDGRYLNEMKNFNPVSIRWENAEFEGVEGVFNYSIFAKTYQDPAWQFPSTFGGTVIPNLAAAGIINAGPDLVWGTADDIRLTNAEASAIGYTMYGRLIPEGSVALPLTTGAMFFEE